MQHQIVTLYTTLPDADSATQLSKALVEKGLIACSNAWAAESTYIWKDSAAQEGEIALLMKLLPKYLPQVLAYIEGHHPYEIPLINYWYSEVNEAYYVWMKRGKQDLLV